MIEMTRLGISFVVDHVLQKDISKVDIIDKLTPYADLVYVHTQSANPIDRHLAREISRRDSGQVLDKEGLTDRAKYHMSNLGNTVEAIDIGAPTLVVNTDDGYDPIFTDIISFVENKQRSER
jgi:hypothetical protein